MNRQKKKKGEEEKRGVRKGNGIGMIKRYSLKAST